MKIVRAGIPVFLLLLPLGKAFSADPDWKPVGEAPRALAPANSSDWKPSGQTTPSPDPFQSSPTPLVVPASGGAATVPPFPSLAPVVPNAVPLITIRPVTVAPSVPVVAVAANVGDDVLILEPVRLQVPQGLLPPPEPAPGVPPATIPPATIPKVAPAPILDAPRTPSAGPAFVPTPAKPTPTPVAGEPRKILPPPEKAKSAEPSIRLPGLREPPAAKPKAEKAPARAVGPAVPQSTSPYRPIGRDVAPILPPTDLPPSLPPASTILPAPTSAVAAETQGPSNRLEKRMDSPRRTSTTYARADYLLWWMSAPRVPLLATTGPLATSGVVGQPGTLPLIGPRELDTSGRSGGRFTFGWSPDDDWGIEGEYFFLSPESTRLGAGSGSYALVSRPYFSQQNGETASVVVAPFLASGVLSVESSSRIDGFHAALTKNLGDLGGFHATALGGFRYLDFREDLTVTESILTGPRALDPLNTRIGVRDSFSTRNRFYGAMLGLNADQCFGRFDVRVRGSISLGAVEQQQDIAGAFSRQVPGQVATFSPRGLFATPSNNGRYSRTEFGAIPEAGVALGYHLTQKVHVTAGYQLLYVSNVLRPGDQLDRVIDSSLISSPPPGAVAGSGTRPAPMFRDTDLFLHGLTFGLEVRW